MPAYRFKAGFRNSHLFWGEVAPSYRFVAGSIGVKATDWSAQVKSSHPRRGRDVKSRTSSSVTRALEKTVRLGLKVILKGVV